MKSRLWWEEKGSLSSTPTTKIIVLKLNNRVCDIGLPFLYVKKERFISLKDFIGLGSVYSLATFSNSNFLNLVKQIFKGEITYDPKIVRRSQSSSE